VNKAVRRLTNILFWSVIAAAFIGPGTVTTAARAGAAYHYSLLWTLVFSTFACIILQEAAARIRIVSGLSLGSAVRKKFTGTSFFRLIILLVSGAILLGSAAYETGNILGAVAGIRIMLPGPSWLWVSVMGAGAAILLFSGAEHTVARILGMLVAVMGVAFLYTAIASRPDLSLVLRGALVPVIPDAGLSAILILGLVGTTVVPYNLFLGSGIGGHNQTIREMRAGLITAIILGGFISMAVLVVGNLVEGPFTFENLVTALATKLGRSAVIVFGLGMLAAGFTSAVTAPLASAITARDLFSEPGNQQWKKGAIWFTLVWVLILIIGMGFGYAGIKPVPAIILAQALNGLILPLITVFLFYIVNDPGIMGKGHLNSSGNNLLMFLVNTVAWLLGLWQLLTVTARVMDLPLKHPSKIIPWVLIVSLVINGLITGKILLIRKREMR